MFSTSGLFSDIDCPNQGDCTLLTCIFRHHQTADAGDTVQEPPAKRRRLSAETGNTFIASSYKQRENPPAFVGTLRSAGTTSEIEELSLGQPASRSDIAWKVAAKAAGQSDAHNNASAQRPISPPPVRRDDKAKPRAASNGTVSSRVNKPQETLNPRMLIKAPADHATRLLYLQKLHDCMVRLNDEAKKSSDPSMKLFALSDGELITHALNEEAKIATDNPILYSNVIKLKMVAYKKKMKVEDWKRELQAAREADVKPTEADDGKGAVSVRTPLITSLTKDEELQVLPHLVANQTGLDQYGYVTSPPSDHDIQQALSTIASNQGFEQCDRCNTRFQVFPERREDGALTSGGRCRYHHGRIAYSERNNSGGYTGPKERLYNCCNEPVGTSAGCVYADCHVFKVNDAKRLASILQFERTPDNPNVAENSGVTFDCEMGYTVYGMELIRLTAVSWPDGKDLLDVLVRPLGQVLDLNSRYSGVYPKDFLDAKPYGAGKQEKADRSLLRIVDSPQAARQLLFKLINPQTPLIGHAIENDLNTTRIIHPAIIDTVLLFPHPSGLPRRRALKTLTKQVLDRDIQTGHGAAGHDSREDAIATGDLVRWQVGKKWKEMQRNGWKSEAGKLVPPPGWKGFKKSSVNSNVNKSLKRSLGDYRHELDEEAA